MCPHEIPQMIREVLEIKEDLLNYRYTFDLKEYMKIIDLNTHH